MSQIVNDSSLFSSNRSPANTLVAYDDFLGGPNAIVTANQVGSFMRAVIAVTGTIAAAPGVADHPGIMACAVVAGADNAYLQSTSSLFPGADAIVIEASVRVVSAGTADTAAIGLGLGLALPATLTARAQIVWQQSTDSWVCQTADGVAVTETVVASTVNTWARLKIALTATQCQFFIDGVLVATHTDDLPASALAPSVGGLGAAGTGVGVIEVDYIAVSQSGLSR